MLPSQFEIFKFRGERLRHQMAAIKHIQLKLFWATARQLFV